MNFKLGELFCGPGGLAYGAKLAAEEYQKEHGSDLPIDHIWGVDMDPMACLTYQENLGGKGLCVDANAFVEGRGEGDNIDDMPNIDGLAFGFPCNDFSLVGEQKGFQGKFGNLYLAGVKAIKYSKPRFFIAENVSGIHSANSDAAFHKILKELSEAGPGYRLTTHLYKFEKYGVPQARHRYIIVGIRNGETNSKGAQLTFKVPDSAPYDNVDVSCRSALHNLDEELLPISDQVKWRLIFTPPGANAWKLDEIVEWDNKRLKEYLKKIPWYKETIEPIGRIDKIRRKIEWCRLHVKTGSKMSHIYKRLVADAPSYTVTGSGGGGTHIYHWEEPRPLTNHERARLQSFPDTFIFKGNKGQVRRQIGMAVPPEGAKIIFRAILDTFAGNDYPVLPEGPSYNPMEEDEFQQYRFKRYKNRVKARLKRDHDLSVSEIDSIDDSITYFIKQEMHLEDAVSNLVRNHGLNSNF